MAEISHDVVAFKNPLKELVLSLQVVKIHSLSLADILILVSTYELILKSVYRPSNVCW